MVFNLDQFEIDINKIKEDTNIFFNYKKEKDKHDRMK